MAYDHAEQEQIAQLKNWWQEYGNAVSWLLIVALAAYLAFSGWNYYQRRQSTQAVQLYEELQKEIRGKNLPRALRAATDLQNKFKRTAYASMAGLLTAKLAVEGNDIQNAQRQLEWVAAQDTDPVFTAFARIRLSSILLDQKKYAPALKLLESDFPKGFENLVADRKGDIWFAQNKIQEAKTSYQSALAKADQKDPLRGLLELKLNDITAAP